MSDKSTVSETLGAAAAPLTISLGERVFSFSPVTQELKSRCERWLREDYRREAFETTGSVERADDMTAQAGARKMFRWLSPYSNQVLATPEGALVLTTLVLGCTEEQALELDRVKGSELGAKLRQVIEESIPAHRRKKGAVPEANGHPTQSSPSATPTTATTTRSGEST